MTAPARYPLQWPVGWKRTLPGQRQRGNFARRGRPVEPGSFPLATGAPARVGRLRAYGNAINAEVARVFVECVQDCLNLPS